MCLFLCAHIQAQAYGCKHASVHMGSYDNLRCLSSPSTLCEIGFVILSHISGHQAHEFPGIPSPHRSAEVATVCALCLAFVGSGDLNLGHLSGKYFDPLSCLTQLSDRVSVFAYVHAHTITCTHNLCTQISISHLY